MNGDSRTMDRPLTGPERRRRRSPSCAVTWWMRWPPSRTRIAGWLCWSTGSSLLEAAEVAL